MAVKIYSDKTNKFYNSIEDANKAEFELKEKENLAKIQKERELALAKEKKEKELAERKALAAEVDAARKELGKAQTAYKEKLEAFCKKYGTYHYTIENADEVPSLFNLFNNFFNL